MYDDFKVESYGNVSDRSYSRYVRKSWENKGKRSCTEGPGRELDGGLMMVENT